MAVKCAKCKEEKDDDRFYRNKNNKNNINSWCKDCMIKHFATPEYRRKQKAENVTRATKWERDNPERASMNKRRSAMKRNYGITLEDYERIFNEQNGKCAISGQTAKHGRHLLVDHDHATGKIRGLVTATVNLWIGYIENHPDWEVKIHEYLARSK